MTAITRDAVRPSPLPLVMLVARLALFALFQALFAVALGSWDASTGYWPLTAALTNIVLIPVLIWLFARDGEAYLRLFRISRAGLAADLSRLAAVLVIALPLAYFPSLWLAKELFGSADVPLAILIRPLPAWAAIAAIMFPLTIMLVELPLYFSYAMPRIEAQTGRAWLAVTIASVFLAAQHVTLPLILDWRFALWRLLMFLPFALVVGIALRRRPGLLPYLVVIHGLMDAGVVALVIQRAMT